MSARWSCSAASRTTCSSPAAPPKTPAPFKAIPDEVDRQGPFGGVYSALRRLQKPILVLSCDLPFMDGPTLRRLLDAREARLPGTIMTTYQQEETGFIEALVAVYEPACLPWFDAAWEQGIRKFSVVIPEELRTHVPYSRSEALPFFNINYPADFEIARRLAGADEEGRDVETGRKRRLGGRGRGFLEKAPPSPLQTSPLPPQRLLYADIRSAPFDVKGRPSSLPEQRKCKNCFNIHYIRSRIEACPSFRNQYPLNAVLF